MFGVKAQMRMRIQNCREGQVAHGQLLLPPGGQASPMAAPCERTPPVATQPLQEAVQAGRLPGAP